MTPTSLPTMSTEPTDNLRIRATCTPRSFRFTAEELNGVSRVAIRIRRTKERCKGSGIDHKLGSGAIDGAVDIQIETIADLNRYGAQSAAIETGRAASNVWLGFQNAQLSLTIQYRSGREKNISSDNSIDFLLVKQLRGPSGALKIDRDHRFIHET